jgi:hypothetical protein
MSTYDDIVQRHAEAAVAEISGRIGDDFPERVRDIAAEQVTDDGAFAACGGVHADARVARLAVRVRSLRCDCGREVRDYDFEAIDEATIRATCPGCHVELLVVEVL